VHHTPAGSPLTARIRSALRSAFSFRARRALPVLLIGVVAGAIAVVALAVPVLSGSGAPVSLDSSSTQSANGGAPVLLGVDGRPATGAPTSQHRAAVASATREQQTRAVPVHTTSAGTSAATSHTTAPRSLVDSSPASSSSASPAARSTSSSPPSSAPPPSTPPSSSAAPSSSQPPAPAPMRSRDVLSLVNAARTDAGCAALTADAALASAAVENSTDMAEQGTPGVLDPAGTSALVAAGDPDADTVVSAWLDDPADEATLLDCGLSSAGVGTVSAPGGPWWTLFLS
jgi:uncharacterized protein YkwD